MLAYISLGSNLGHPRQNLQEANQRVNQLVGVEIVRSSKVYKTEPQDFKGQSWFANQVLELKIRPDWTPFSLLESLLVIEEQMGRVREFLWGPRCIDLDLLLYGQEIIFSDRLILPHPRIKKRAFILVPLVDIDPSLKFPDGGSPEKALNSLDYRLEYKTIWQA